MRRVGWDGDRGSRYLRQELDGVLVAVVAIAAKSLNRTVSDLAAITSHSLRCRRERLQFGQSRTSTPPSSTIGISSSAKRSRQDFSVVGSYWPRLTKNGEFIHLRPFPSEYVKCKPIWTFTKLHLPNDLGASHPAARGIQRRCLFHRPAGARRPRRQNRN